MELLIDIAFFSGDDLISQGSVRCGASKIISRLDGVSGHRFEITSKFEEPACPVEIRCCCQEKELYKAALRVGVHTSDDWESVDLAGIHTLGFRCHELA